MRDTSKNFPCVLVAVARSVLEELQTRRYIALSMNTHTNNETNNEYTN